MTGSHRASIAVVDDDHRVLEALEDLLESAGHSVRLFSSAEAFLNGNCLPDIDCLISDINMPGIDGFALQRTARKTRPELPVILITAHHEASDQQRATAQGVQGFFRKPFDASALLALVNRLTGTARGGP